MICDRNFFNIIMLGVAFMLLFTSFQTTSMAEQSVILGVKNETGGNFTGSGYVSQAIIYTIFAAANWVAPVIVGAFGPRISMFVSAILYVLFIASFLIPNTVLLYIGSVLVGLAAAVIWTAQGNYLALNSNTMTTGRNSGVFWALLQSSLIIGNIYLVVDLQGKTQILGTVRTQIFAVFTAVGGAGAICFLFLRKPMSESSHLLGSTDDDLAESTGEDRNRIAGHWNVFVYSFKLMMTKRMLLLMVPFAYTGLELTFFSGVYGTCLGNTQAFGNSAKSYIGLAGIFIGIGEILGGLGFGILGKKTVRYGRDGIVVFGYIIHMISFYLIFINVPAEAPINATHELAYITPNVAVAMLSAFFMGLGDSSFNTQIYSILSDKYKQESAAAFALFKFMQSLCAAIGFFYSQHLILQWQLLILVVWGTAGVFCYTAAEWINESSGESRPIQAEY